METETGARWLMALADGYTHDSRVIRDMGREPKAVEFEHIAHTLREVATDVRRNAAYAEHVPRKPAPTEWLRREDVAAMYGVAPSTVSGWIKQGLLAAHRLPGGQLRIHPENADAIARPLELVGDEPDLYQPEDDVVLPDPKDIARAAAIVWPEDPEPDLTCEWCGEDMTDLAHRSTRRFCSDTCRKAKRRSEQRKDRLARNGQ